MTDNEKMIAFVLARLDEDESRHNSQRVLDDIAAKRAIVDLYAEKADSDVPDPEPEYPYGRAVGLGEAVRLIAAVWKDHPDYDHAWRPQDD